MYCNPDDVKGKLNITGTTYDDALLSHCKTVSVWIDEWCGYPVDSFIVATNTTRYYYPQDICGNVLHLDMPLVSISSVTNGDGSAITSGMYRLQPRNFDRKYEIMLLTSYSWLFSVDGEVTVTGKFGYSTSAPAPVTEAATQFAGWIFKRYQAALQDATANFDLGQLVYSKAVPDQIKALLEPYKRIV